MNPDSKSTTIHGINLRLAGNTFAAIDAAPAGRPGGVSRHTWIAEAIEETLARERGASAANDGESRAHG